MKTLLNEGKLRVCCQLDYPKRMAKGSFPKKENIKEKKKAFIHQEELSKQNY